MTPPVRASFKDHFSGHAASYATYRPKSPKELFSYLASLCPEKNAAWDVGTGNGQAAIELAPYFDTVIATDPSKEQIANAVANPKVTYKVSSAEDSKLDDRSVNLVTVAQAIHWFQFDKFYSEVRRVSRPQSIVAAWTYALASITPEIDEIVLQYYDGDIKEYWPPETRFVDEKYQTIPFPFKEIKAPHFEMQDHRTFDEWLGYLFTWSATQRAIKQNGPAVFDTFAQKLKAKWGDVTEPRQVTWPLYMRVGHVS